MQAKHKEDNARGHSPYFQEAYKSKCTGEKAFQADIVGHCARYGLRALRQHLNSEYDRKLIIECLGSDLCMLQYAILVRAFSDNNYRLYHHLE